MVEEHAPLGHKGLGIWDPFVCKGCLAQEADGSSVPCFQRKELQFCPILLAWVDLAVSAKAGKEVIEVTEDNLQSELYRVDLKPILVHSEISFRADVVVLAGGPVEQCYVDVPLYAVALQAEEAVVA